MNNIAFPDKEQILLAAGRIVSMVHHTPVITSATFDTMWQTSLFFKCENFQKAGAFKSRGAINAVFSLSDEQAQHGVCTHSSGNHAQALARAAKLRGIVCYIVMPKNVPLVKVAAVEGYGGIITFCEPTSEAREKTLSTVKAKTGATEIHPYDNLQVIAGQATAALELLYEIPEIDIVLVPVGGGGLLSGTALSAYWFSEKTKVIACEPDGADDARKSFVSGKIIPCINPQTIADGLLTSLGKLTFPIIQNYVSDIVTVEDKSIKKAMKLIYERMKIVVEPSAAVPLAAILENKIVSRGRKVGIILSGGNVDTNKLTELLQ